MLGRIADLTWRRPKMVLALVGAFTVLAAGLGQRRRAPPEGRGLHRQRVGERARHRAPARSAGLRPQPGDRPAGARARTAGGWTSRSPAVRARGRPPERAQLAQTRYVGRVVNPLAEPREGRALIAPTAARWCSPAGLSAQDIEDKGGDAAEDAQGACSPRSLDVSMGGFAPGFNEVNDQTRKDLTKAELIAFPAAGVAAAARVPRGRRRGDAAADRRAVDPRHVPRAAADVDVRRTRRSSR